MFITSAVSRREHPLAYTRCITALSSMGSLERKICKSEGLAVGENIRRDAAERALLDPIYLDLLKPARAQRMAKEMQADYVRWQRDLQQSDNQVPLEIEAVESRISRLRERLMHGDPDLTSDELAGAIARAEEKRKALLKAASRTDESAKIISVIPRAAEEYREQIRLGLKGDEIASLSARCFLRQLFGGAIKLMPDPAGGLFAEYNLQRTALLGKVGTDGGPCRSRT
jgi:hypothetical protein